MVFQTDHKKDSQATLHISDKVVSHIEVQPERLFSGVLDDLGSHEQSMIVRSLIKKKFLLKEPRSDVEGFTVDGVPEDDTATVWRLIVRQQSRLTPGLVKGKISVRTDDKDMPQLIIPMTGMVVQKTGGRGL